MTEAVDLSKTAAQEPENDTPSMRGVLFLKDPSETLELDIVNLEGVIIGMRVDGSALLYVPWTRVRYLEVPKSLNAAEDD